VPGEARFARTVVPPACRRTGRSRLTFSDRVIRSRTLCLAIERAGPSNLTNWQANGPGVRSKGRSSAISPA
jgi:hypothetical protein